jgi:hypothetical protein
VFVFTLDEQAASSSPSVDEVSSTLDEQAATQSTTEANAGRAVRARARRGVFMVAAHERAACRARLRTKIGNEPSSLDICAVDRDH